MTGYPWLKLYNEIADDPKFPTAARMAGTTRAVALAAFIKAMTHANQAEDRGSIKGLHPAVVAEVCGATVDEIRRLWQAFRELGMLLGERIANWVKRQVVEKPRSAVAERVAKHRRKKAADSRQLDLGLAPVLAEQSSVTGVTSAVTPAPATLLQAIENAVISIPLLESESDIRKEEKEVPPLAPPRGSGREGEPTNVVAIRPEKDGADGRPARGRRVRSDRGTRLPEDWEPGPGDIEFARRQGLDLGDTLDEFRCYWCALPGAKGLKLDWSATWRNSCRLAARRGGGNSKGGGPGSAGGSILAGFRLARSYRMQAERVDDTMGLRDEISRVRSELRRAPG